LSGRRLHGGNHQSSVVERKLDEAKPKGKGTTATTLVAMSIPPITVRCDAPKPEREQEKSRCGNTSPQGGHEQLVSSWRLLSKAWAMGNFLEDQQKCESTEGFKG